MDEISPTARSLLVLEMIQSRPGVGAAQLAERLGFTDRAVRRHVAVLREAGIPVESTRGRYGGYRVGRGVRVPPLMFTQTEALALAMAVLEGHAASDPEDPVGSALGKIVRVLPEPLARPMDAIRQVRARGWEVRAPDVETTAALVEASAQQCRVRLVYRLGRDREREIDLDPWAVVVRHRRWYLLGWSHTKDARRVLRVDRVVRMTRLAETFEPPEDLDAVAAVEEQLSQGWRYPVEVTIEASLAEVEHWLPRSFGRLEAIDERRTRLVATTDEPDWYAAQLAAQPFAFRVVGSPEVEAAVRALARRLRVATDGSQPGGMTAGASS